MDPCRDISSSSLFCIHFECPKLRPTGKIPTCVHLLFNKQCLLLAKANINCRGQDRPLSCYFSLPWPSGQHAFEHFFEELYILATYLNPHIYAAVRICHLILYFYVLGSNRFSCLYMERLLLIMRLTALGGMYCPLSLAFQASLENFSSICLS